MLKEEIFEGDEQALHELFDAGILLYRIFPRRGDQRNGNSNGNNMKPTVTAFSSLIMHCFRQLVEDPELVPLMNRLVRQEEEKKRKKAAAQPQL